MFALLGGFGGPEKDRIFFLLKGVCRHRWTLQEDWHLLLLHIINRLPRLLRLLRLLMRLLMRLLVELLVLLWYGWLQLWRTWMQDGRKDVGPGAEHSDPLLFGSLQVHFIVCHLPSIFGDELLVVLLEIHPHSTRKAS